MKFTATLSSQCSNRSVHTIKLSKFEQNLGNTPIHNPLIVKHSGCRPKAEKQPNLTYVDNTLDTASTNFLGAAVNRDLQLRMAISF